MIAKMAETQNLFVVGSNPTLGTMKSTIEVTFAFLPPVVMPGWSRDHWIGRDLYGKDDPWIPWPIYLKHWIRSKDLCDLPFEICRSVGW